jgi:hypothetical protein
LELEAFVVPSVDEGRWRAEAVYLGRLVVLMRRGVISVGQDPSDREISWS